MYIAFQNEPFKDSTASMSNVRILSMSVGEETNHSSSSHSAPAKKCQAFFAHQWIYQ